MLLSTPLNQPELQRILKHINIHHAQTHLPTRLLQLTLLDTPNGASIAALARNKIDGRFNNCLRQNLSAALFAQTIQLEVFTNSILFGEFLAKVNSTEGALPITAAAPEHAAQAQPLQPTFILPRKTQPKA